MQTRRFVIALMVFHSIFAPYARAIETNCPWNLRQLMGKAADELEPSTQLALQDILKGVYDNPPAHGKPLNSKTSVADDLWLNDYQMWDAVKLMAELGHQRLKREAADRKRRLLRASFFGAIGVLGGGAILSILMDKEHFSLLPDPLGNENDVTDEEEIGVKIPKVKSNEPIINLLREMAACDPHASIASAKKRIGGQFSGQEKYGLSADQAIDRLVTGGSKYPQEVAEVKDILLKLRKEFGLVICTRWGHPSQETLSLDNLEEIYFVLESLPEKVTEGRSPTRLVLSKSEYWNVSPEYPEMEALQLGKDGEIQYFSTSSLYRLNDRLAEIWVAKKLLEVAPEKVRQWEQAVGPDGNAVLNRLFLSYSADVSISGLKSLSYAVAHNANDQALGELERFDKRAGDLLRETIAQLGFKTQPFKSGWKTPEAERREEEKRRKQNDRDRRRRGWDR